MPTVRARDRDRLVDFLARDHLLVVLLAALTALLALLAPYLLVADSWMTLVAGREIVAHGLPGTEKLTSIPFGRDWVDQQWLAQIAFHAVESLGGLRGALALNIVAVVAAFGIALAAARLRGASARSTLLVGLACVLAAPWAWQLRAQSLALPLFTAVLGLMTTDPGLRRRRTLLVAPVLVVWANIHGSVVIGAAIVSLAGAAALVSRTAGWDASPVGRAVACTVLPWAATLASPYAAGLPGYYRTVLVDSPIADVVTEWRPSSPQGWQLLFFAIAAVTTVLVVWQWRRLTVLDVAVLVLTLASALRSQRAIVWFVLAVAVIVPLALDGILRRDPDVPRRRAGPVIALATSTAALVALVAGLARSGAELEEDWPSGALAAVARPDAGAVLSSDRHANWLLWRARALRGRVAYDVRFELLTAEEIGEIVAYKSLHPGWEKLVRRYDTVVVDLRSTPDNAAALEELGALPLYADETVVVLALPDGR